MCREHTPAPRGNVHSIHVLVVMETFSSLLPPSAFSLTSTAETSLGLSTHQNLLSLPKLAKVHWVLLCFSSASASHQRSQGGRRSALPCGTRPISQMDRFPARNLSDANNNHDAIFVVAVVLFVSVQHWAWKERHRDSQNKNVKPKTCIRCSYYRGNV